MATPILTTYSTNVTGINQKTVSTSATKTALIIGMIFATTHINMINPNMSPIIFSIIKKIFLITFGPDKSLKINHIRGLASNLKKFNNKQI